MRIIAAILFGISIPFQMDAQVVVPVTTTVEQKLENHTENTGDIETEDDAYLQQMQRFVAHPLNLNDADETELAALQMLTPLQIQNVILYRSVFGNFIDIYELQAIPSWDTATIEKIRPFISVSIVPDIFETLRSRLTKGRYSVLMRLAQVPERSRGYMPDTSSSQSHFLGSPQKLFVRFTYAYRNSLQYGVLAEKDAGEQLFKGRQKQGFDFYSVHFFARNIGLIRALALGDFTVNMGQGLIQWQSLAFKKSSDVMNIKRQSAILLPYHSAGEINFHRGAGITLSKKRWQASGFLSYKRTDANLVRDSISGSEDFVSSLQNSGYHRTAGENQDKGIQRQLAFGGNLSWQNNGLHLGINGIQYRFKLPLEKPAEPYNQFALSGRSFGNYSLDYSFSLQNLHFFGEAAFTNHFDKALIMGLMISASRFVDLSLLFRSISKSYQALNAGAFTENSFPNNEKGLYMGIELRPRNAWRIDAYGDLYQFPWLKYRVDAPSNGCDFLVQVAYTPDKQLEMYCRYHLGSKAINDDPEALELPQITGQRHQNLRVQFSYKADHSITLRSRMEMSWFDSRGLLPEQGFLTNFDILFKPLLKRYSGVFRMQYFETGGYNSRIYAYENDVMYSFSIPVFYDKGYRYYINLNYDINKRLTFLTRWAQFLYANKNLIGSGSDEIRGNSKSEIKVQLIYRF